MAWIFEFAETAKKQLKKLDKQVQERIVQYLRDDIAMLDDPRDRGKVLRGKFVGYWRYHVDNYRVVCNINTKQLLILAINRMTRPDADVIND